MTTCVVQMFVSEPVLRHVVRLVLCGKPSKGERATPDGQEWPVCGIHLRSKRGMVETRPGHSKSLAPPVAPLDR